MLHGTLRVGDTLEAQVDATLRQRIRRNHSATHLLHAALRRVLGEHVAQKGSLVDSERLRFDFSHPQAVTAQQLKTIEQLVNAQIRANTAVSTRLMSMEEAVAAGIADTIAGGADASTYASHAAAQVRPDIHAKRRIDAALAQQGIPRSERRAMLKQITGTRNAAEPATHDAGFDPAALRQLLDTLQA